MEMLYVKNGIMPVIKATRREFIACYRDYVFCHACESDESAFTDMFYIPTIDCVFCKHCADLYAKDAIIYKIDRKKAQKNYLDMQQKMVDIGTWEEIRV